MKTQYEILTEDPEFKKDLAIETLALNAAGVVAGLMAEQAVTKAGLARRLNKSRAWITQLLGGKANMTIRTLAEVVHALGAEVSLQGLRR
jgi:DNA-binding phage protein